MLRGGAVTHRHNSILDALAAVARRAGCHVWIEPSLDRVDRDARRDRPDAIIFGRYIGRGMVDVSVVNPTALSYINRRGDCIERREKPILRRQCDILTGGHHAPAPAMFRVSKSTGAM